METLRCLATIDGGAEREVAGRERERGGRTVNIQAQRDKTVVSHRLGAGTVHKPMNSARRISSIN
jgi:hypothetical protein